MMGWHYSYNDTHNHHSVTVSMYHCVDLPLGQWAFAWVSLGIFCTIGKFILGEKVFGHGLMFGGGDQPGLLATVQIVLS